MLNADGRRRARRPRCVDRIGRDGPSPDDRATTARSVQRLARRSAPADPDRARPAPASAPRRRRRGVARRSAPVLPPTGAGSAGRRRRRLIAGLASLARGRCRDRRRRCRRAPRGARGHIRSPSGGVDRTPAISSTDRGPRRRRSAATPVARRDHPGRRRPTLPAPSSRDRPGSPRRRHAAQAGRRRHDVADGRMLQHYGSRPATRSAASRSRFGVSMMTVWWANKLESKDDAPASARTCSSRRSTGVVVTVKARRHARDARPARTRSSPTRSSSSTSSRTRTSSSARCSSSRAPRARRSRRRSRRPSPQRAPPAARRGGGGGGGDVVGGGRSTYNGGAGRGRSSAAATTSASTSTYGHYGARHRGRLRHDRRRRGQRARGLRRLEEQRRRLPGLDLPRQRHVHDVQPHVVGLASAAAQYVGRGEQRRAASASSGWATGPHLHFEVWIGAALESGGYRVNPLRYF